MWNTRDLRALIGYHTWMITVGGALVYHLVAVGLIYFYPNTMSLTRKDPVSGLENRDVGVQSALLVAFSIMGIGIIWFSSVIQMFKYTAGVKVKYGSFFEVCYRQTVVFFAFNVLIAAMAPILGIFLDTLAWPLYVFGIGISLKVTRELENHEIDRKPTFMPILMKDDI